MGKTVGVVFNEMYMKKLYDIQWYLSDGFKRKKYITRNEAVRRSVDAYHKHISSAIHAPYPTTEDDDLLIRRDDPRFHPQKEE